MRRDPQAPTGPPRALGIAFICAIPFLLLGLIEAALRFSDATDAYPLFVSVPGDTTQLQANPNAIQRFYRSSPELAIEPIAFEQPKPPGRLRIVVQGGSTAAGFPYGRWGGLAGMLGDRIERADPGREADVITTAMAAVNSYALLDFVDEIIAIEPDAVLIYAGHNEYLGILGVGSALTAAPWRRVTNFHLGLREFRLYQQMRGAVAWLRSWRRQPASEPGAESNRGTLMAGAARSSRIEFGSELYRRGTEQFDQNLAEILRRYRDSGISVYVGTLVSNEKDLSPFDGAPIPGRAEAESADAWFARAERERAAGRHDEARTAYRGAKDRDRLRFRAPEAFNEILRRLAGVHGARVVEVQRSFTRASPNGIVGHELISEHVHPTAEGYFLLADSFYRALSEDGVIVEGPHAPRFARARASMPITGIDHWLAARSIAELKSDFPFRSDRVEVHSPAPSNAIERIAEQRHAGEISWLEGMEALLQLHRAAGRLERAAVVARIAAQAYPGEAAPNLSAGLLCARNGDYALARRYLRRTLRADPEQPQADRALARVEAALAQ
jgi:lysophospholipase L1-like esterase